MNLLKKTLKTIIIFIFLILSLISCKNNKQTWEKLYNLDKIPSLETAQSPSNGNALVGFLNDKVGLTINNGNGVFITKDGGKKWEEWQLKAPPCISGMEIIDEQNYMVGCVCSNIKIKSDDADWLSLDFSNYNMLSFTKNKNGWIADHNSIKQINNDFKNGNSIDLPTSLGNIAGISCVSNTEGYYINNYGVLFKSTDSGENWEEINLMEIYKNLIFDSSVTSLRFTDINNGLIITFDKNKKGWVVLETNDAGKSWDMSLLIKDNFGSSYLSIDNQYITINSINGKYPAMIFRKKVS